MIPFVYMYIYIYRDICIWPSILLVASFFATTIVVCVARIVVYAGRAPPAIVVAHINYYIHMHVIYIYIYVHVYTYICTDIFNTDNKTTVFVHFVLELHARCNESIDRNGSSFLRWIMLPVRKVSVVAANQNYILSPTL